MKKTKDIVEIMKNLENPRQKNKVKYPINEVDLMRDRAFRNQLL